LGNYMNGGTGKGQAYGFELSSLTSIKGSKSINNNVTLFDYVVEYLQKHSDGQVLDIRTELPDVEEATRVEKDFLFGAVSKLSENLKKLEAVLKTKPGLLGAIGGLFKKAEEKEVDERDKFIPIMAGFHVECKDKLTALASRLKDCDKACKKLMEKYGEDGEKLKWEEFFAVFTEFKTLFLESTEKLQKAKEAEEKKAKQAEAARVREAKKAAAVEAAKVKPGAERKKERKDKKVNVSDEEKGSDSKKEIKGLNQEKKKEKKADSPLIVPDPLTPTGFLTKENSRPSSLGQKRGSWLKIEDKKKESEDKKKESDKKVENKISKEKLENQALEVKGSRIEQAGPGPPDEKKKSSDIEKNDDSKKLVEVKKKGWTMYCTWM